MIVEDIARELAAYADLPYNKFGSLPSQKKSSLFEQFAAHNLFSQHAPNLSKSQVEDAHFGGIGQGAEPGEVLAIFVNGEYLPNDQTDVELLETVDLRSVLFLGLKATTASSSDRAELDITGRAWCDLFVIGQTHQNESEPRTNRRRQISNILTYILTGRKTAALQAALYLVSLEEGGDSDAAQLRDFRERTAQSVRVNLGVDTVTTIDLIGLDRFREILSSQNRSKPDATSSATRVATIRNARMSHMDPTDDIQSAMVGIVPALEYINILERTDGTGIIEDLSEYNVRNFLGADKPVNRHIAETITSGRADEFAFLNNGVVVVADQIGYDGQSLKLKNYFIVNGLQTSLILHGLKRELQESQAACNVVLKVVASLDVEKRREISRASNRQNAVDPLTLQSDLFVLRKISRAFDVRRSMDQRFDAGLSLGSDVALRQDDGVHWISRDDLIRVMGATFLRRPHAAASGASAFKDSVPNRLLNESHPTEPYCLGARILGIVDDYMDTHPSIDGRFRYHLAYGLFVMAEKNDLKFDLSSPGIAQTCEELESKLNSRKVGKVLGVLEDALAAVASNAKKRKVKGRLELGEKALTQPLTHSLHHRRAKLRW